MMDARKPSRPENFAGYQKCRPCGRMHSEAADLNDLLRVIQSLPKQ